MGGHVSKKMWKLPIALFISSFFITHNLLLTDVEAAEVDPRSDLRIVHLSGRPYELGRQHGEALRNEVRASVHQVLSYFRRYLRIPIVGSWVGSLWLDRSWARARPFIPEEIIDELRGLSDASGVPMKELYRFHAIPDRTYSCASFAAWGPATSDGRLIHVRNLDWNIDAGIQQFATVFVVHPEGKHAFLNVGWAGFIGVLSGINEEQISIGQIGAETLDATFRGLPMAFLMRRILEESDNLSEAVQIIKESPRTVGVNYIVADAKMERAVAVETTHKHIRIFEADDPQERNISYARPMAFSVFRADTAMDPEIRELQLASNGNPNRRGLEDPSGSSAYGVRYLGQVQGLKDNVGKLDILRAQEIAGSVAPDSNVQSVIFAWPEVFIANAQGKVPAAQTDYLKINVRELLSKSR